MEPGDEELMARTQARDEAAFEALLGRYGAALRRHLAHTLRDEAAADDLAQELFLRLWQRADQWDGRGSLRAWLFLIASNLALNHLRGERRRPHRSLDQTVWTSPDGIAPEAELPAWIFDALPGPDELAERSEDAARLRALVSGLPAEKRAVLQLVHDADLSLAEVAALLGVPLGTVKSRLHYATRRLAAEWRAEDDDA